MSSKSQDSQTTSKAHDSTRTLQDHPDQLICLRPTHGLYSNSPQWCVAPSYVTPSRCFPGPPFIQPPKLQFPSRTSLTNYFKSSPGVASPVSPGVGSASGRPSSPTPPGGPKTAIRRRAAADQKERVANARPASTRAAGAGGSSSTMLSMSFICNS